MFLIIHAENLPVMFQGESDQNNLYSPLYQCLTFFLVVLDYFEQGRKSCDKKVTLIIGKLISAGEKEERDRKWLLTQTTMMIHIGSCS